MSSPPSKLAWKNQNPQQKKAALSTNKQGVCVLTNYVALAFNTTNLCWHYWTDEQLRSCLVVTKPTPTPLN
jgi:hypothetical protein